MCKRNHSFPHTPAQRTGERPGYAPVPVGTFGSYVHRAPRCDETTLRGIAAVTERRQCIAALTVALAARIPALVLGTEHYGDGPVRVELAERWLRAPHLWHGFAETYQYGALHLTAIAAALKLWPDRHLSPQVLSLACGLASIWLLYRIARTAVGAEAAFVAALGLALSPLHIQASTTAASEAPFLALLLGCIALLLDDRIVVPALLLGAAGMVRYDGWMYVPLCGALVFARQRRLGDAALFCALAALPVPFWLWLNAKWTGDWLAPVHYIDRDHRNLADMGLRWFGPIRYRLYCLVYFPWAVLVWSTPVLGALSLFGAARAIVRRERTFALAVLAWAPAAYLAFRGAVLADFRPLARFALVASTLSLPFAWGVVARWPARLRAATAALAGAALVATPVALVFASYGRNGGTAEWARPVSPISSVPPGIVQAVQWLRANAKPGDSMLLDSAWHYLDIPLAFATDFPESRLVRYRWGDHAARFDREQPTIAILLYQGVLRYDPDARDATEESDRFAYRGVRYCLAARFVYATVYRRCEEKEITRGL
jgi:Dolichyl-phosphate-mannose-protein mannosyltransferase